MPAPERCKKNGIAPSWPQGGRSNRLKRAKLRNGSPHSRHGGRRCLASGVFRFARTVHHMGCRVVPEQALAETVHRIVPNKKTRRRSSVWVRNRRLSNRSTASRDAQSITETDLRAITSVARWISLCVGATGARPRAAPAPARDSRGRA